MYCCCYRCFNCSDEFEEEGILEKLTPISRPQTKSDAATAAGEELSGVKETRKESRRISVGVMESKKRTREEEEYVPQPVSVTSLSRRVLRPSAGECYVPPPASVTSLGR